MLRAALILALLGALLALPAVAEMQTVSSSRASAEVRPERDFDDGIVF